MPWVDRPYKPRKIAHTAIHADTGCACRCGWKGVAFKNHLDEVRARAAHPSGK